jgi:WD40 repeat protein
VNAVAVSRDARRAVSASADQTLRVWNLASGQVEHVLVGHEDWVNAVAVTPDGLRAASASADWILRVWDLARGLCLAAMHLDSSLRCVTLTTNPALVRDDPACAFWLLAGDLLGSLYCLRYEEPKGPADAEG